MHFTRHEFGGSPRLRFLRTEHNLKHNFKQKLKQNFRGRHLWGLHRRGRHLRTTAFLEDKKLVTSAKFYFGGWQLWRTATLEDNKSVTSATFKQYHQQENFFTHTPGSVVTTVKRE